MARMITLVGFAALTTLVAGTALAAQASTTTTTVTPPPGAAASTGGAAAKAFTVGKPSAALLLGYGFKDGYNFGFGARGGYTLPMGVYVGGTLVYHLGKDSVNILYLGPEGGYDIAAGPVVVRPSLGLGLAIAKGQTMACTYTLAGPSCTSESTSDSRFSLWPGAMVAYPINNFFIGGDVRYVIVTGTGGGDASAFSMFLTGGMIF